MLVKAQPCPLETEPFGGAPLDGSADEYEQYWAVTDDDLARIISIRMCTCCEIVTPNHKFFGLPQHFRGFEAEIYSPTSGIHKQQFGVVDGNDRTTECFTH